MADTIIRVLLVEDSPSDALLVEEELSGVPGFKFEVTQASRLIDAFEQLKEQSFSVVLLDLTLPDSDGFETFARLREAALDVPIIVLTVLSDQGLAFRTIEAGAQDYLVKGHLEEQFLARSIRTAIERKRGEEMLRSLSRELNEKNTELIARNEQIAEQAALLDKAQDAIHVRDLQGVVTFWNKGAERMYGWLRQDILGQNINELLYTNPQVFQEANGLTISRGDWSGELHQLTKDKREISVEARWTLIRDQEGQPKSVLAINTDITDRKKIEAQFLRAQRMESIGTLAGGIAHDLNNILAPIMMSIDLLRAYSDNPKAESILKTIQISAKRGADIVRQVLSFARGLEGERIEIRPGQLLKDIESIIKDTFPKDIRLEFSVPDDTWTILGDPTQLHQVLLNLCLNARDSMPNGGMLSIRTENCELDEQFLLMDVHAKAGRYVKIGVIDSGMGIPQKLIDKIFEPFFTTKDFSKGTGLGLSTVMAIVKSHGGIINVYSELGKGTKFSVYLPAKATASEETGELIIEESPARGHGEMVLVIDDEASILTITSQTLQAFGYRVLTAPDGAAAVAIYAQHRQDIAVVLTDLMMPIMDGLAAIHALKRINPAIKIIAASGLNTEDKASKAAAAGIKYFLTKPYTAATLLKAVRTILDEI